MSRPQLSEALPKASLIHDQATLTSAIERVGAEIGDQLRGRSAVFLSIMQGGLVFAGQLATAIAADLAQILGQCLAIEALECHRPQHRQGERRHNRELDPIRTEDGVETASVHHYPAEQDGQHQAGRAHGRVIQYKPPLAHVVE